MTEHASDALLLLAADGVMRYASPPIERLLGSTPQECVGRNVRAFVTTEDLPIVTDALAAVQRRTGETIVVEHRCEHTDGTRRWLESTMTSLPGEPCAGTIVSHVRDVTARRQMENGLRFQTALLRAQREASIDGVLVVSPRGEVLSFNRRYVDLWEIPDDVLATHSDAALLDIVTQQLLEPEAFLARVAELYRQPEVESREEIRLRDGRVLDRFSAPVIGDDGVHYGRIWCFRDITERARAEAGQRFLAEASTILAGSLDYETELERIARLMVPALADWCVVDLLGEDGALRRLAIVHRDPGRAGAAAELQRRYPVLDPEQTHTIWDVLREGRPWFDPDVSDARFAAEARDSEHQNLLRQLGYAAEMVLPLIARGRPLGVITLVLSDLRRRYTPQDLALAQELARRAALAIDNARLYQEAQDAIQARDQFLSIAAHELRNPVTVLKAAADLLHRPQSAGPAAEARRQRLLHQIARAADRLVLLTDELLDVSRLHLGQLPLRWEPLDLTAFVPELAMRSREQWDDRHRLAIHVPEAPCVIQVDTGRLEQVLVNLLDNAVKYSPNGGTIELGVRPDGDGVLIVVRDEGIGLPPGAAETIFEPFGRAANTAEIPGMGLGLSICRSIVERHGGRIWAESAGEGEGAVMRLWLPRDGRGGEQPATTRRE
jgi:PAS domain S-box-containing protein